MVSILFLPKSLCLCHGFLGNFAHYCDGISGQFAFVLEVNFHKVVEGALKKANVFLSP